jgi:Trk-type K+ transport system membrane component
MMCISVYPIAMTIRGTNVNEEQSLGIYFAEDDGKGSFLGLFTTIIH